MCEANVYIVDDEGREELVMEAVDKVIPSDGEILLEDIFSERKILKAEIKEMALLTHKVILRKI